MSSMVDYGLSHARVNLRSGCHEHLSQSPGSCALSGPEMSLAANLSVSSRPFLQKSPLGLYWTAPKNTQTHRPERLHRASDSMIVHALGVQGLGRYTSNTTQNIMLNIFTHIYIHIYICILVYTNIHRHLQRYTFSVFPRTRTLTCRLPMDPHYLDPCYSFGPMYTRSIHAVGVDWGPTTEFGQVPFAYFLQLVGTNEPVKVPFWAYSWRSRVLPRKPTGFPLNSKRVF